MSDLGTSTPPAEVTPSAPAAPAASPTPAPAAAAAATPQAAPLAPASGAPTVEPSWLKGRLDETRAAATRQAQQQYQQQQQQLQAQYEARLQQVQQQLHALVGVTPPGDPEVQKVRDQFGQLYPGLSRLEERAEQLLGNLDRSGDLDAQNSHYWQSYGRQTMNQLFEKAQESLGTPLTEAGKRQLHAAFTGYVSQSPEMANRYASDPTLVDEFWGAFTSSFIDPSRRAASAAVVARTGTPLPADAPSGAPRIPGAPKPANLDERAAQSWAQYQQLANQK